MNVRKKVKVGDVFFIPITKNLFGIGWITCKCEGTFLCEFFIPVNEKTMYKKDILCQKSLFSKWIYSAGLKAGIEEPHDYYEVPENYEFPYFASSYNISRGEIYISQATEDVLKYEKKEIVTQQEAKKYSLEGIALGYGSVLQAYNRRLKERNLFIKELENFSQDN